MSVYKTIKLLRIFHGWSQEEISCKLNISQNGYGCIERGDTNISLSRLEEIANLFGISLSELIQLSEKELLNNEKEFFEKDIKYRSFQKSEEKNLVKYINSQKNHEIQNVLFEAKQIEIDLLRKVNQLLENENKTKSKENASYFLLDQPFIDGDFVKKVNQKIILCEKNISFSMYVIGFKAKKILSQQLSIQEANDLISQIKLRITLLISDVEIFTEFGHLQLIFLSNFYKTEQVINLVQKVLVSLSYPFKTIHDEYISIYSNVGIGIYPQDGTDAKILRKNTYIAYNYSCKQNIHYSIFTPQMYQDILNEEELYENLWNSVEQKKFEVFYQPQLKTKTGEMVSIEALLRVQYGKNKYTLPIFIRDTHLIIEAGEYVLREACRQGSQWIKLGLTNIKIAINISIIQFEFCNIFELINNITKEFEFPPHLLELEIGGFNEMGNNHCFFNAIESLRRLGVNIVLDEFHLDTSSLNFLDRIPTKKVKVSSHILKNIQSESCQEMFEYTVSILKKKKFEIVCVGIEKKKN